MGIQQFQMIPITVMATAASAMQSAICSPLSDDRFRSRNSPVNMPNNAETMAGSVLSNPSGSNDPQANVPGSHWRSTHPAIFPATESGSVPSGASGATTRYISSE